VWRRFAPHWLESLVDAPREGAPGQIDGQVVERLIAFTLEMPINATRWNARSMVRRAGMSQTAVEPGLADVWLATAPGGDVQAPGRSSLGGEGP
jgi:hypothetical protein